MTARGIDESQLREYGFDGGPYLGFDRSHDLYGDGSLVIVPAPCHTSGSIVVFVTLPGGRQAEPATHLTRRARSGIVGDSSRARRAGERVDSRRRGE